MTIDDEFMKFMTDNYNVNFIDTGKGKPKKPPEVPPEWRGMYSLAKRDAMYYEKCLKDMRVKQMRTVAETEKACKADPWKIATGSAEAYVGLLDEVLAHEYELDGVDLDKPNYGMF